MLKNITEQVVCINNKSRAWTHARDKYGSSPDSLTGDEAFGVCPGQNSKTF